MTPKFKHPEGGIFIGRPFSDDVYIKGNNFLVRYGDNPNDFHALDIASFVISKDTYPWESSINFALAELKLKELRHHI